MEKTDLGIYIHIPFCIKKCYYCDFNSYSNLHINQREYMDEIIKEMDLFTNNHNDLKYRIRTIYIGGGTPSLMDANEIDRALKHIRRLFVIEEDAEVTIEVNPKTVDLNKFLQYKTMGINRISIGLQSAVDEELNALGRAHDFYEFTKCFQEAREAGFLNINVDVMSRIPKQTSETLEYTLLEVLKRSPEHISVYSLIVEEDSVFGKRKESLVLPSEDEECIMDELIENMLSRNGYFKYEVSNYARISKEKDFRSRHNGSYWDGTSYLGLGAGASSLIGDCRMDNICDVQEYMLKVGTKFVNINKLSQQDRMEEFCFLGLRRTEGIQVQKFMEKFGVSIGTVYGEVIDQYSKTGHLIQEEGKIYFSKEGMKVSNLILSGFIK